MKGIIFTTLADLIQETHGPELWERSLARAGLSGAYTDAGTYEDSELMALMASLSEETGDSVTSLVFAFGEFMLLRMSERYANFFARRKLKDFLLSLDRLIHVEVGKLYPDARLPKFDYEFPPEAPGAQKLVMIYESKRGLCDLAEGFISGAGRYFDRKIECRQTKCTRRGDIRCRFELEWKEP